MDVSRQIKASIELKTKVLNDSELLGEIVRAIDCIVNCYRQQAKVLFCGNGGSAADAQHLAAELSGRFYLNRPPLSAEALHVNTSFITATANDDSFENIYARMTEALGKKGDVLVAFSTSGRSPNVIRALEKARSLGMSCIGFCGENPGPMSHLCDILFVVPSSDTPRIQEVHILIGHIICEEVESSLFQHQLHQNSQINHEA